MKKSPYFLALGGALALGAALLLPRESQGQAADSTDPALTQALVEIGAQQVIIAENQAKLDEKLALVAEDVRIGKIFVGRGGGKVK